MLPALLAFFGRSAAAKAVGSAVSHHESKKEIGKAGVGLGFSGSAVGAAGASESPGQAPKPAATPPAVTQRDATSLLQSTVQLLGKISNQLQRSLDFDMSRYRSDKENFLERHTKDRGGSGNDGGGGNSGGEKQGPGMTATLVGGAAAGVIALLANAKKIQKQTDEFLKPANDWLNRTGQRIGSAVGGAVDRVKSAVGGEIGSVVAKYESGTKGYGAVSSGKGDPGGASYGKYQLAGGRGGTLGSFLNKSGYGSQFNGMAVGSSQFNSKWKELAKNDKNFGKSQHEYIAKKLYEPAIKHAANLGFPVDDARIQEMIWSGAIQHGGIKKILTMTANHPQFSKMTVDQIVKRYYMVRSQYAVNAIKRNGGSSGVIQGVANRMVNEVKDVLNMGASAARSVGGAIKSAGQTVAATVTGVNSSLYKEGRDAQSQGYKVSELRGFGGVQARKYKNGKLTSGHHGEGHYDGRAFDMGELGDKDSNAESSPRLRKKWDAIAQSYVKKGYIVIWNGRQYDPNGTSKPEAGHKDHIHVEVPRDGLFHKGDRPAEPMVTMRPEPPRAAPKRAPLQRPVQNENQQVQQLINQLPPRQMVNGRPASQQPQKGSSIPSPSANRGTMDYAIYFDTSRKN